MRDRRRKDEEGIALVLALLSLMLLTFLGLALAATTSTELQIANNYRWSQQAFYNAEAGIEIAKKVLGSVDWTTVVPDARKDGTDPLTWLGYPGTPPAGDGDTLAPPEAISAGSRNYENYACDWRGHGMGYGEVLNDGAFTYANVSSGDAVHAQTLRGAFTIWIRRPVEPKAIEVTNGGVTTMELTGRYQDVADGNSVVITAEGVAPYSGGAAGQALAQQYQAVRTLEATISNRSVSTVCETPGGQTGGSEGSNFGKCFALDPASLCAVLGASTCSKDADGNWVAPKDAPDVR